MTRKIRWTEAEAAAEIAWLASRWPGWRFWHVPGGPYGDVFCGSRIDQEQPAVHGYSPGELTQHIADHLDDEAEAERETGRGQPWTSAT